MITTPISFIKSYEFYFCAKKFHEESSIAKNLKNTPARKFPRSQYRFSLKQSKIVFITKAFAGMPDGRVKVDVIVDGRSQGMSTLTIRNKMDVLSSIMKNVTNPVDFLCSSLGCNDVETLDLELNDMITNGIGDYNPLSGLDSRNRDDHLISKVLYVKK